MPPANATILERLRTAYQRGERLVLVFDYDGTLTKILAYIRTCADEIVLCKSCCAWRICPAPPSRWNSTSSCTRAWRRWRVRVKARMEPRYSAFTVSHFGKQGWNATWDCGYPPCTRTKGSP